MPRKATAVEQERPSFVEALRGLADAKGLSDEEVLHALEEATERAYVKELGGGDDAVVSCHIDPETGKVTLAQIKDVVDEVTDDYLQISVEDANEGLAEPKYKAGDKFAIYEDIADASKVMAKAVKNNFRQKLGEAERTALYKIYKDHIGEMMVGTVEKSDDKTTTISIGRTTIELTRKELIGDEYFRIGDQIKVYIQEVRPAAPIDGKPMRAPQIEATRSSEGFLKRLFEEEIHEIYDGTVVIKAIARKAGYRSKVAVSSNNEDVDATGACIGQGGSRIQKIVQQLGNGKDKEKIDIIAYSDYMPLYIAESLRPAQVLGVAMEGEGDDENARPVATVIVNDGHTRLAIGRRGANVRLAKKLTGWDIDIVPLSEATEDGLVYTPIEEIKEEAAKAKKEKDKAEYLASSLKAAAEKATMKAEEEKPEEVPAEEAKKAEEATAAPAEEKAEAPKAEPAVETKAEEAPKAAETPAAPAVEKPAKPVVHTEVKTTTTLEDLEKELSEKKDEPIRRGGEKKRRPRRISEEEVERVKPSEMPANVLPIYSDEELAEIEAEESEESLDDDIDESDYDQYDSYYDDDGK